MRVAALLSIQGQRRLRNCNRSWASLWGEISPPEEFFYPFLLIFTRLRAPLSRPLASMQWVEQLMHGS